MSERKRFGETSISERAFIEKGVFSKEGLQTVAAAIPIEDAAEAYTEAKPNIPLDNAKQIIGASRDRLVFLGPASFSPFYGVPLALLREAEVIPEDYVANELGPDVFGAWAGMNPSIKPGKVNGVEKDPGIAAAARVALAGYEKAGFIPPDYEVIAGDESADLPPAHVRILSLVSEYGTGEGVIEWMNQREGEIGINGDVVHGPIEVAMKDIKEGGVIPIRTRRRPNITTGVGWVLDQKIEETRMGIVFEAHLASLDEVYEQKHVAHLALPGYTDSTKLVVFEEDGQLYAEGWGFIPKSEASEEETEMMISVRRTIHDLWGNMGAATNGEEIWDGNAALGVPAYAAEKGLYTAMTVTTAPKLAGPMPLVILIRNRAAVEFLHGAGDYLSQIGPGSEGLKEFYEKLGSALAAGMHQKFEFVSPPHVTTITTDNREIFQKIVAAAS